MRTKAIFRPFALFILALMFSPALTYGGAQAQEDEVPPIVRYMKRVNSDLRHLRRQVREVTTKPQALETIADIRKNLVAAREEKPLKTPEIPENEREKFLQAYQDMIDLVLVDLDALEKAVESEDLIAAKDLTRKLYDWKKKGHKDFQKDPDS